MFIISSSNTKSNACSLGLFVYHCFRRFLWVDGKHEIIWLFSSVCKYKLKIYETKLKLLNEKNFFWINLLKLWKTALCDSLRDLVPFVQFKKREKHPWRKNRAKDHIQPSDLRAGLKFVQGLTMNKWGCLLVSC